MKPEGLDINTEYPCDGSNYTKCDSRAVSWIVVHYTGSTGSALANVKYFMSPGREASAHYFIGHESEGGRIYQSVNPKDKAWHCGTTGTYYSTCRNTTSIGIEVACHNDSSDKLPESGNWYFDAVTVDSLVSLTKALMEEYGVDADHVIRHYDVTHKICPAPYVCDEAAWHAFKARLTGDTGHETEDDNTVRYNKLSDIPNDNGFRDNIETLMNAKIIKGDGSDPTGNNDVIDLSLDQVRMLIFIYRGGGFDRKLEAEGYDPVVKV